MKANYSSFRIAFLITMMCLFTAEFTIAQDWYDTDWKYRREVTVANPAGTTLSDFQVEVNLDSSFDYAKANSDGSDILITAEDGITIIPFWIELWEPATLQAILWTKLTTLPITGLSIHIYYGNTNPNIPPLEPVENPPAGPFTKDPNNPIIPIGDPGNGEDLLAENIVYDSVSGHYWLSFASYRGVFSTGLVWSDNPTDATAWNWHGSVVTNCYAPHLLKHDGIWYIFYADRGHGGPPYPISVSSSSNVNGPYTYLGSVLESSEPWEAYRVSEPYVLQRNDGKWILIYMGDSGGFIEQIGYAVADDILGPYTKFEGNPCLAFGPPGSYDAGTIADPWVYEHDSIYYIGYTVSPTNSSPWQTALATTTDWQTFTKEGILVPTGNEFNTFRGAITRIDNEYVFSYTGGPSIGEYRMGIATQPVFLIPPNIVNNGNEVFDFFDDFEESSIDLTKWTFVNGNSTQTTVDNGLLTLTATSDYVKILGINSFGMDYMGETRGYHPDQGTLDLVAETGFSDVSWNVLRILDDINSTTYWQRQAKLSGPPNIIEDMNVPADTNWHIFHVYRESPDIGGFQIDDFPVETVNTNVPTMDLPLFLMSYGNTNRFIVDWTRVRKWAGADASTSVEEEQSIKFLELKVYLEGPFNGIDMNTNLTDLTILQLSQPYNTAPWNYTGTESVAFIPNADIVDWILIELRDTTQAEYATGETMIYQQAAFLLNNGSVVDLDGSSILSFYHSILQSLFVVIWHRNYLGIMSANVSIPDPEGIYTYDFTTAASQVFGNGLNDLGSGIFGMIGGDANADGIINLSDAVQSWIPQAGHAGYLNADINLDGQVNNPDKNDCWLMNIYKESHVPE